MIGTTAVRFLGREMVVEMGMNLVVLGPFSKYGSPPFPQCTCITLPTTDRSLRLPSLPICTSPQP